jgi:hypothetical protein
MVDGWWSSNIEKSYVPMQVVDAFQITRKQRNLSSSLVQCRLQEAKRKPLVSTIKIKRMPIDKKWLINGFVVSLAAH